MMGRGGEEERSVVGMGFCDSGESVWVSGKRGKKHFFCVLFVRPQELDFLQEGGEGGERRGRGGRGRVKMSLMKLFLGIRV